MAMIRINGAEILSNYIREKIANELGNTVSENEFNAFVAELLHVLNGDSKNPNVYLLEDTDFAVICQNAISSPSTNLWQKELKYKNGELIANMAVKSRLNETFCVEHYEVIKNFFSQYFAKKVANKELNKCEFRPVQKYLQCEEITKKTAAYLTEKIMQQYVNQEVSLLRWPAEKKDVKENILKDDLGTKLGVMGTRENFLDFYRNAIDVINSRISKGDEVFISNDEGYKFAYAEFLKLVQPFPFLKDCRYDEDRKDDIQFNVFTREGVSRIRKCVGIDSCDNGKIFACEMQDLRNYDYHIIEDYLG